METTNLGAVGISAGGVYNPETVYKKYKVVSANGGSYMYINPTPAAGVPVTDTSHWQQIASQGLKGDAGGTWTKGEDIPLQSGGTVGEKLAEIQNDFSEAVGAVTVDSEVVLARGGKTILGDRLDEITQEHNSVAGYGVVSGLNVERKLPIAMKVKVLAGVAYLPSYTKVEPVYTELAVTAADATHPRIDIVYVDSLGVSRVFAGTPSATPVAPTVPEGGLVVAEIYVAANATTLDTETITDKRTYKYGNNELGLGVTAIKKRFEEEIYTISDMPIYADKTLTGVNTMFSGLEILSTHHYALACPYGMSIQKFYKVDPVTLQQSVLFDPEQEIPPYWQCAKLLPSGNAQYDFIIAWDMNTQKVFKFTTNGVIKTGFADQKFGWLRNTGIDWTPTAAGVLSATEPLMYAEYILTSYDNYVATTEVKVWRSVDRGTTWTNVFSQNTRNHANPEIYHFHCLRRDPFNTGHWYLGSGDEPSECHIWRSIDDGLTWTNVDDPVFVGTEKQEIHRTCNMYFTPDYIYWGMDGNVNEDGLGTQWVRAKRNLTGNAPLTIEPLADVGNYVRNTIQTPYGILLLTEKRPYDNENALVWLIKYDDLTHPILIDRRPDVDNGYGDQVMEYSYGNRIFVKDSKFANYGYAPAKRSRFYVMTLSKSTRGVSL